MGLAARKLRMTPPAAGGGGSFVPTDVAGSVIWVKADDLSLSDADPVSTWTDLSSVGGNDLSSTSTARPIYKTSILNGLPVVRFDGSNDTIINASFSLTLPATVFQVVSFGVTSSFRILHDQNSTGNGLGTYLNGTSVNIEAGGSGGSTGLTVATSTTYIVATVYNGGSSGVYLNGGTIGSRSVGSDTFDGIRLGLNRTGGAALNGDVGEFIVYDSALSTANINLVGNYLERWGATWTDI